MSNLLATIEETKAAIDTVDESKKMPLVNSMINLTKKLIDNVLSFKDIPEGYRETTYPAITAQLQAAEKRTQKAADDVMTATENIMSAMSEIEGAGKDKIQKEINSLFEACNFGDLVVQHIMEIRTLSKDLAEDMEALEASMDELGDGSGKARERKAKRPDAHLLNGPATNV